MYTEEDLISLGKLFHSHNSIEVWLVPHWCAMPPLDISPTTKFVPTWYQQKIISPWACKRRGVNEYGVLIHGVAYIVRGGGGIFRGFTVAY